MLDGVHVCIHSVLIIPRIVDHFQSINNWNGFLLLLLFIVFLLLGLQAGIWRWLIEDIFFGWCFDASGLSEQLGHICSHLFLGNKSIVRGIHFVEDLVDCLSIQNFAGVLIIVRIFRVR